VHGSSDTHTCTHAWPKPPLPLPLLQAAKGRAAEGRLDPQEVEQLEVLWEKTRLQLVFAAS
jgi:hypothetical protein